jgi:hypothetical protein
MRILATLSCVALAGCGGRVTEHAGKTECPVETVGNSIWVPGDCIRDVIADDNGGGFGPSQPPGSTCAGDSHYVVSFGPNYLWWRTCSRQQPSWQPMTGSRALMQQEVDTVIAALKEAKVSAGGSRGADKSSEFLTVETLAVTERYTDSFYGCTPPGPYLDHIDAVFQAIIPLVQ